MANTTTASELVVTKFLSDFFREYVRKNRFARYTGTTNNNVICIKEGKQRIEIPLVTRLKGDGVSGSSTLRGNGEAIGNYGLLLTPTYYRHAVEFDKEEMEKPAIDLMRAARPLLMEWAMDSCRNRQIEAMAAIYDGTTYANLGDASDANANTWLTNNSDRILYGELTANLSAGDHSASLTAIATADAKLDPDIVSLAKRMAENADPHIRPIRTTEDEEYFVMFCDPYAFRDLSAHATMTAANRDARERGTNNPLFAAGDLLWDGVIIRKIPEIATFIDGSSGTNGKWGGLATANGLNTAEAASGRVGVNFLCGQQAVSFGMGQRPKTVVDKLHDYEFQPGVACELKEDVQKSYFNNKQHGMVTVFTASATD